MGLGMGRGRQRRFGAVGEQPAPLRGGGAGLIGAAGRREGFVEVARARGAGLLGTAGARGGHTCGFEGCRTIRFEIISEKMVLPLLQKLANTIGLRNTSE